MNSEKNMDLTLSDAWTLTLEYNVTLQSTDTTYYRRQREIPQFLHFLISNLILSLLKIPFILSDALRLTTEVKVMLQSSVAAY